MVKAGRTIVTPRKLNVLTKATKDMFSSSWKIKQSVLDQFPDDQKAALTELLEEAKNLSGND